MKKSIFYTFIVANYSYVIIKYLVLFKSKGKHSLYLC